MFGSEGAACRRVDAPNRGPGATKPTRSDARSWKSRTRAGRRTARTCVACPCWCGSRAYRLAAVHGATWGGDLRRTLLRPATAHGDSLRREAGKHGRWPVSCKASERRESQARCPAHDPASGPKGMPGSGCWTRTPGHHAVPPPLLTRARMRGCRSSSAMTLGVANPETQTQRRSRRWAAADWPGSGQSLGAVALVRAGRLRATGFVGKASALRHGLDGPGCNQAPARERSVSSSQAPGARYSTERFTARSTSSGVRSTTVLVATAPDEFTAIAIAAALSLSGKSAIT
jgi:hypothetical protein